MRARCSGHRFRRCQSLVPSAYVRRLEGLKRRYEGRSPMVLWETNTRRYAYEFIYLFSLFSFLPHTSESDLQLHRSLQTVRHAFACRAMVLCAPMCPPCLSGCTYRAFLSDAFLMLGLFWVLFGTALSLCFSKYVRGCP